MEPQVLCCLLVCSVSLDTRLRDDTQHKLSKSVGTVVGWFTSEITGQRDLNALSPTSGGGRGSEGGGGGAVSAQGSV